MTKFETDGGGNVIMKPLTGWNILPVAGAAVLVQMLYVETPEELERTERRVIQFALTPPMALELVAALKRVAEPLLPVAPGTPVN